MREYIDIVYDGVLLSEKNGIQINDSTGAFTEDFLANKRIIEEKIRGRDEPYFFGVERDCISFPLAFYFDELMTEERKREIARLLDHDTYKPLYAKDNPQRIYYAMCINTPQQIHNGIQMGYFTFEFRTSSPYAFSPVYIDRYDLIDNTNGEKITFNNKGDVVCKPVFEVTMLEDGDFSIRNLSNMGDEIKFTDLQADETVIIDCSQRDIDSDVTDRYNNFNDEFLSFREHSKNHLLVHGKCILKIKYQFKWK